MRAMTEKTTWPGQHLDAPVLGTILQWGGKMLDTVKFT
jgi:hypothetical protein